MLGRVLSGTKRCWVCGRDDGYSQSPAISDELATQWRLNRWERAAFDRREGQRCDACGAALRSRVLAKAVAESLGLPHTPFWELVQTEQFHGLNVAEINPCGDLHGHLADCPNVTGSVFRPGDPDHQDLAVLSWPDESFDLALHSETLEHVPDVDRALAEIRRVLKPGGRQIFTVPIILWRRKSVQRARIGSSGPVEHLKPQSYHGTGDEDDMLVFWEFGRDFLPRLEAAGFKVRASFAGKRPSNVAAVAISAEAV